MAGLKVISTKQLALIFGNIEQLLQTHTGFLQIIEQIDNLQDAKAYTDIFISNVLNFNLG